MKRNTVILSLTVLLLSARIASADFYDDCVQECSKAQSDCIAAITFSDPAGIQEAQDACNNAMPGCKAKCHEQDSLGVEEYQKKQDAEAEIRRQQQENGANDGVKAYQPGE
jgi:hypothetical protein